MIGYRSTGPRSAAVPSFGEALLQGQAPDGGLFMPERVPAIDIGALLGLDFRRRAAKVLSAWLEDEVAPDLVDVLCERAFAFPVPVVALDPSTWLVELFHGPTAAFKDFGARFMAQAMAMLRDPERLLTILVATSGDTGSAVAHAFAPLPTVRVVLLYPAGMVSPLQELQLTAVGENVFSLRVEGTFDDCQALVKGAFADPELVRALGLTSANSINVGRLLPQASYYVHAVLEMLAATPGAGAGAGAGAGMPRRGRPSPRPAASPVVCVPSGNLGNLTAGLLARRQGAPIAHFVAATNRNDAFVRYLGSGRLRAEPAVPTPSNAMDVGNPSNLARIEALYGHDVKALRRDVSGVTIDDAETLRTMREVHAESGRFVCPHTAVGIAALRRHRHRTRDDRPAVVLATAHPAKFADHVRAATGDAPPLPPALARLASAQRAPRALRADPKALGAFLRRLA